MKKNIFISLLVFILTIFISIEVFSTKFTLLDERDFRNTIWEMSKKQVKIIEEEKWIYENSDGLFYKVKIDKYDCYCGYYFLEDKLYRSAYIFTEEHINKNAYIEDYENLKELLTKKYGKAAWENVIWIDDFYKDIKGNWGTAVARGDLRYVVTWETPTTLVQMKLEGENYEIILNIEYYSKELMEWANEIKDKKTIKDL